MVAFGVNHWHNSFSWAGVKSGPIYKSIYCGVGAERPGSDKAPLLTRLNPPKGSEMVKEVVTEVICSGRRKGKVDIKRRYA